MVSALYKACAVGDAPQVTELLKDASSVDIEVKDHTGVTPLIQAVRHGHVEVVKLLVDAGADPHNASSVGRPENYTSDPAILELLSAAAAKHQQQPQQPQPVQNGNGVPPPQQQHVPGPYMQYQPAPDGSYAYYPPQPIPYGAQPYPGYGPEGAQMNGHPPVQYYAMPGPPPSGQQQPMQPPQPHQQQPHEQQLQQNGQPHVNGTGNGGNNLPPAHVARAIPCRYFPACKYGASCMFLHPQTPYFQGPMPPPAQYPPQNQFDPMSPPHPAQQYLPQPGYYPPGAYPAPPPHSHPGSPPQPPMHGHSRGPSEVVVSPMIMSPALPPPGMVPYGMPVAAHMSPYAVQHGLPPMGMPNPMSPPMYPGSVPMMPAPLPPMSPYHHTRRDSIAAYPPVPGPVPEFGSPLIQTDVNGLPTSPRQVHNSMDGGYAGAPHHARDGSGHRGRGGRASIGGGRGKPPCLFYPSGRCRNGDACRFPHVMPSENATPGTPSRLGKPRGSLAGLENKFSNMAIVETNGAPTTNGVKTNGSVDHGNRGGFTGRGAAPAGVRKPQSPPKPQRVPVAEDFPVLGGAHAPPLAQNGHVNGHGPTAAEVVRAAAAASQKDATRPAATVESAKATVDAPALETAAPEVPVTA